MSELPNLGYEVYNDLQRSLPVIARLLSKGAISLTVHDLEVLRPYVHQRRYMHKPELTDTPIRFEGLTDHLPPIIREVKNKRRGWSGRTAVEGITIYKCRGKEVLYAVLAIKDTSDYGRLMTFHIVEKKQAKAWKKHIKSQNDIAEKTTAPPLLAPGMLEEIIDASVGFLKRSSKIEQYGVRIKKGLLMDGDPGNGKTMICKWIKKLCSDEGFTYGLITNGEIDSCYSSSEGLSELFNRFHVTVFDDVDISYLTRGQGKDSKACALLAAMDPVEDEEHRIRIFTTNEDVKNLDPAFFRPQRLDRRFNFLPPDDELREKLVLTYWPKELQDNIRPSMTDFIAQTAKFNFADLEAIRTLMVEHFVFEGGEWDWQKAIDKFCNDRDGKQVFLKSKIGYQ